MRGSDLSAEQLQKFAGSLRPKLVYVRKVKARMLQANFPSNDRMFRDVGIAEMALQDLLMEVETLLNYKAPGSSNDG